MWIHNAVLGECEKLSNEMFLHDDIKRMCVHVRGFESLFIVPPAGPAVKVEHYTTAYHI